MTLDIIKSGIKVKKSPGSWEQGNARTISLVITEDCQLRCKYCYLHGKNKINTMSIKTAQDIIEFFIRERALFNEKSVIFEFMGGEAFMEIDLIDKISDYIKIRLFEENHPWFNSYRFSFSTNGILYGSKKVQDYIDKNISHVSIGITIDGTREKHDLQRIYPDGSGSYDDVVKNIPLWLKQFPEASTKVTIASKDIPYIKDSVLHIWSLGVKNININCVFEEVWEKDDDKLFEEQLVTLADHIIDNEFYNEYFCSFFTDYIGKPIPAENNSNWCGCGKKMIAVDYKGNFYPCNRFMPFSMSEKKGRSIGNYNDGLDFNKLRPFLSLDRISQNPEECNSCDVASGCALCVGLNYDAADSDTVYQRAVFICKMHKARVRANDYYWKKIIEKERK